MTSEQASHSHDKTATGVLDKHVQAGDTDWHARWRLLTATEE